MLTPEGRRQRARAAAYQRHHPDDPAFAEDRRELKAAAAARYIAELTGSFPPLTMAQRARLASQLLTPGDAS